MKKRYSLKRNYLLACSLLTLFLVFTSCSKEENEVVNDTIESSESVSSDEKTPEELNYVDNDGSFGLTGEEAVAIEEEAPTGVAGKGNSAISSKSARNYTCNYTLLTPSDLTKKDVDSIACGDTKTLPLLVGSSKKKVGRITVANDGENLYISLKANRYKYMEKVYLYIGEKGNIPFYSNGFPNLRKFNFKAFPYYYGGRKQATYVVPLSSIDADCFEIVAYSKIYDAYSNCLYSAFGYNPERTQEYTYSYYTGCYYFGEWVRSFEYCKQSCAPECIQAYGYHEECGFCEDDVFNTFLAYSFIDRNGDKGFKIELITNPNGCDISTSTEVGHINVAAAGDTKLKIEYHLNEGYQMCDLSFSYGTSRLNTPNNYSQTFDTPTSTFSFEIDRLTGANIYMNSGTQITESN